MQQRAALHGGRSAQAIGQRAQIILEPIARNTAPAIAVAALSALQKSQDAIIVVLAADHLIENTEEFRRCLDIAIEAAEERKLVTFGVVPTKPETGYGYIKTAANNSPVKPVLQFVENPTVNWRKNIWLRVVITGIGMFVFPAAPLVDELERLQPELVRHARASLENAQKDLDFLRLGCSKF